MDLSHNNLKGEIPEEISQLDQIVLLNLSNNLLTGGIPTTFTHLLSIQYINLSRNGLSGSVPVFLGHLTMLEELDLSYNNFDGANPLWRASVSKSAGARFQTAQCFTWVEPAELFFISHPIHFLARIQFLFSHVNLACVN